MEQGQTPGSKHLAECDKSKDNCSRIKYSDSHLLIYYDLELTDGSFASEIYQIGGKTGNSNFSSFMLPKGSIDWGVTKYAGGITITKDRDGQRQLTKKCVTIDSVDTKEGLVRFIKWIKHSKKEGNFEKVILIAHGNLDMPALLNNLARDNLMGRFRCTVDYFADSLTYCQTKFKNWGKYNVPFLHKKVFNREKADVHDALEDATALHDIMEEINKETKETYIETLLQQSFSVEAGHKMAKTRIARSLNKKPMKKHRMTKNLIRFLAL